MLKRQYKSAALEKKDKAIQRQYKSAALEKKDKAIQGKRRAHKKKRIRRNNEVKVGDDFSSNKNLDFKLVSKFLKNASEDILTEIFLRLPNYRFAIFFGSVCRPWHSVIFQPQFISSFIRHHRDHQDRYILPRTIIFRSSDIYMARGVQCFQPLCILSYEESMFVHKKASSSKFLDFMPSIMIIRASFDDLLLVSSSTRNDSDYYICNPVTKQWFQLPEFPGRQFPTGFALFCMPEDCSNKQQYGAQYQYKAVIIKHYVYEDTEAIRHEEDEAIRNGIRAHVFCSKSGNWSCSFFSYPISKEIKFNGYLEIVTCKGILYWPENKFTSARIISLDLFNGPRCSVIDFPYDLVQDSCGETHLGVVGEELRLLHVFKARDEECCFVMKIWELKYNKDGSTSWVLVHEINLKSTKEMISGLAVHPNNGDVVFMIWGKHLFQYKISQDMYEKVDELQESFPGERILSIPLVHPAWPTPVPSQRPSI